jgi:phenylalanine-4-hydroxylase
LLDRAETGAGLTTGGSAFIEQAQESGQYFIHQPYHLYSEANHAAWRRLYAGMEERWARHANAPFLRGLDALRLDPCHVPRLTDVNKFLRPLTGFQAVAVSGFLPAFVFFDCLSRREFPTTITMRDASEAFAPWPDIFHDITGHVPMHTDPAFADVLVRFGRCAHTAAEMVSGIADADEQARRLTSIIRAMARFFWFTIETGLMRSPEGLKVYGSALLSSRAEMDRAVDPALVQQSPLQLEWVIHQGFLPNFFQPLLFVVDSFDHLFGLVGELEDWMRHGKLDDVAPGEPNISASDVQSFLQGAGTR